MPSRYDRNGAIAARGTVLEAGSGQMLLRNPYFASNPAHRRPRSSSAASMLRSFSLPCQRVQQQARRCAGHRNSAHRGNHCASYRTISCDAEMQGSRRRLHRLRRRRAQLDADGDAGARLEPLGCELAASEEFGLPAEAKEAAAFALLAWQTWHQLPGNVPAATGAKRPRFWDR